MFFGTIFFIDQHFLRPKKNFRPKIFFRPKFSFWTKNFFGPKDFWTKNIRDDKQQYSGDDEMNVKKGPEDSVMKTMNENDDNGTIVPETGTPSVNKDGWCFTHNCKTTTISVKSKIW